MNRTAQFTLHRSWEELRRYANLKRENLREIVMLPNGDRVERPAPVKIVTMPPPPAIELAPPMTRASRSPVFAATSFNV